MYISLLAVSGEAAITGLLFPRLQGAGPTVGRGLGWLHAPPSHASATPGFGQDPQVSSKELGQRGVDMWQDHLRCPLSCRGVSTASVGAGGFSTTSLPVFSRGLPSPSELMLDGKISTQWFTHKAKWVEAEAGVSCDGLRVVACLSFTHSYCLTL